MATVVRQPFAPLNATQLHNLYDMENEHNVMSPVSSLAKRKFEDFFDANDYENHDPALFLAKRVRMNPEGTVDDLMPAAAYESRAARMWDAERVLPLRPGKAIMPQPSLPSSTLNSKSPIKKTVSSRAKAISSPLPAPAGRSPPRGNKRRGVSKRQGGGRVERPASKSSKKRSSLGSMMKGTAPMFVPPSSANGWNVIGMDSLYETGMKSSWFFDIYEDTPEDEMNMMLESGTRRLDISSDEECEERLRRETADGFGKENVAPADYVSPITSSRRPSAGSRAGVSYREPRPPLRELNAELFYGQGVSRSDVVIVPGDDEDDAVVEVRDPRQEPRRLSTLDVDPGMVAAVTDVRATTGSRRSPLLDSLQPPEDDQENFVLWESSSAQGYENAPSPVPRSPLWEDEGIW